MSVMSINEVFNYTNERFSFLRDPMREVMSAYGSAEKWFATLKEWALMKLNAPNLSAAIHALEHKQPERIDTFADLFRPWHLMVEYPATDELTEEIDSVPRLFEACIIIIEKVDEALRGFLAEVDNTEFHSMVVTVEDLMRENNDDRIKLMQAWGIWKPDQEMTSFDQFVARLFGED